MKKLINSKRLKKEFASLVSMDSPTYGEREVADYLTEQLKALGFSVQEDNANEGFSGNAGNLYGYKEGSIEGPPLLFSAHMDTVEPSKGKQAVFCENGKITSSGDTVLGADDVSGIVEIMEAIRVIFENDIPHRSIEVLFTIAEESFCMGSLAFDYKQLKSKESYVLDLSGEIGTAAIQAPSIISFIGTVTGRSAHAGFEPEAGIHAIKAMADIVSNISVGKIDEFTRVNIGRIQGGNGVNIIPDHCSIQGEVRSLNHETALAQTEKIRNVFKEITSQYGAGYTLELETSCRAYKMDKNAGLITRFETVCSKLNIESKLIHTFGGSDLNNFQLHGVSGVVIACGMHDVHSVKEYTTMRELELVTEIVIELMTE